MSRRRFSSVAARTTLASPITNVATSLVVTAAVGYPGTTPFTIIVDADTVNEEVMEVTNVAGTTFTVTRGVDGTTGVAHSAGAVVQHGVSARDFDEANAHVNDVTTNVHSQYVLGAKGVVAATTGTVTASSSVPTTVTITAATGSGTTTSSANYWSHFFLSSGTEYKFQIDNLAGDVIPAATITAIKALPVGTTVRISNAASTVWRSMVMNYAAPRGYTNAAGDVIRIYCNGTVSGNATTDLVMEQGVDAGCFMDFKYSVYTLTTDISNLSTLLAAEPKRVLTIGGVVYPRSAYTVSGGVITLTYTTGLSIPTTTAVSLSSGAQVLFTGTGGSQTVTLGYEDAGGLTIESSTVRTVVNANDNTGTGEVYGILVENKVAGDDPTIVVRGSGAASVPTIAFQRSGGTPSTGYKSPVDMDLGTIEWGGYNSRTNDWFEDQYAALSVQAKSASTSTLTEYGFNWYPAMTASAEEFNLEAWTKWTINGVNMMPMHKAWISFTPTVSGTGWAYGNATSSSAYCQIGRSVFYRIIINWGSTSTFGTGNLIIGGFPAGKATNLQHAGAAAYNDQSAALTWSGYTNLQGTNLECYNVTTGSRTAVINTLPFTWANGDSLFANGTYEAAANYV